MIMNVGYNNPNVTGLSGKALPRIIYPESMWVGYTIRSKEDAPKIVDLFWLQYERLRRKPKIISPR